MARSRSITLQHRIEFALFRGALAVMRALTWRAAFRVGAGLGRLFWLLDPHHRRIVRANLRSTDMELTEGEIRQLTRQCFANFGSMLFSTLRMLTLSPEAIRRLVRIEGLEHFDAALAEGKGAIGLTGHFGHWELMALALSMEGRTLAVIGRELDNPLLEPFLRELRGRFGNTVLAKDGAVRESLKALKRNQVVGFLLDQDAGRNGVFARFFGRWASTFPTAGMLATRYDLPVLPIFNRVHADGTLTVHIRAPFHAPKSGDPEADTLQATRLMTRCIEDEVRQDPAWWFWMHRRFKTAPQDA
nr:lysophospholipid acyltransferase family protein [uncultured Holophaga sp.]